MKKLKPLKKINKINTFHFPPFFNPISISSPCTLVLSVVAFWLHSCEAEGESSADEHQTNDALLKSEGGVDMAMQGDGGMVKQSSSSSSSFATGSLLPGHVKQSRSDPSRRGLRRYIFGIVSRAR